MSSIKPSNVIRLYDVKPEMALEHLKRTTGLDFESVPESLAELANQSRVKPELSEPPVLTDIVREQVYRKG